MFVTLKGKAEVFRRLIRCDWESAAPRARRRRRRREWADSRGWVWKGGQWVDDSNRTGWTEGE